MIRGMSRENRQRGFEGGETKQKAAAVQERRDRHNTVLVITASTW